MVQAGKTKTNRGEPAPGSEGAGGEGMGTQASSPWVTLGYAAEGVKHKKKAKAIDTAGECPTCVTPRCVASHRWGDEIMGVCDLF